MRWPSGRRRTPGTRVGGQPSPGFESLSHRQTGLHTHKSKPFITNMNPFPKVKICGIRDTDTLSVAQEAGVNYVGFVIVEKSPRYVSLSEVKSFFPQIDQTTAVALLTDPTDSTIDEVSNLGIQTIQLHGHETPSRVKEIKQRSNAEIWKSIGISNVLDLNQSLFYDYADKILFDAKPAPNADRQGGHGRSFDWQILKSFIIDKPWILAGGLCPSNIKDALRETNAEFVDVSSGVESSLGVKDPQLIRDFMRAVRNDRS